MGLQPGGGQVDMSVPEANMNSQTLECCAEGMKPGESVQDGQQLHSCPSGASGPKASQLGALVATLAVHMPLARPMSDLCCTR